MIVFNVFFFFACGSADVSQVTSVEKKVTPARSNIVENPLTTSLKTKKKGMIGGVAILPQTIVLGGIENRAVTEILEGIESSASSCFDLVRKEKKLVSGKVLVGFKILETGLTRDVSSLSSTIRHSPTEDCLVSLITALRFPKLGTGPHAIVKHPFSFDGASK